MSEDVLAHARALLSAGEDAVAACETAVQVTQDLPEAFEYLGVALRRAGRHQEAETMFRRALELQSGSASVHANLANLLKDMGRAQEAIEACRTALMLDPGLTVARFNLALLLVAQGQRDEPEGLLQRVIEETPFLADAHNALGMLQAERGEWAWAEAALRRALQLDPRLAAAQFNLADVLFHQLRSEEAGPHLQQAIGLAPTQGMPRAFQVVQTLPGVPQTREQADGAAVAFDRALQDHADWRACCAGTITSDTIGRPPFLLAYREGNHVDRLSRFADEVGPPRSFTLLLPASRRPRLRLGMVSDCFRRHSVWEVIVKGLLKHLDRSRFEVCLYHISPIDDPETSVAESLCDRWLDTWSVPDSSRWASAIAEDRPDLLFYPALGLEAQSYLLARERLAPVQAVGWGHPITSGLASMDLFFSGDLLEPAQAHSHYRERLVRLPGTGACTTAPAWPDEGLPAALAGDLASRDGPTILVPQTPYKFDPRFDALLARVVEAVGPCSMVIPCFAGWGAAYDILAARLGSALRARGIDAGAVLKFIPWVGQRQFGALLDAADVVLDLPSFSGYTTAWLAAHRGAPMVTLEGPLMRQRLAAGVYRKLGITDTVVDCEDAYVKVATAIALERRGSAAGQARRQALRAAAPSLDGDVSVVRAFEQALLQAFEERR